MQAYEKTFWSDNEGEPLNAENLNHIESGIETVTNAAINTDEEIAAARGSYTNLKDRLDHTGAPTDEQVAEAVSDYLDEHPIEGNLEKVKNKKTSISNQSQEGDSDTNYPTVGAVRDFVNLVKDDLEDYVDEAIGGIENGSY